MLTSGRTFQPTDLLLFLSTTELTYLGCGAWEQTGKWWPARVNRRATIVSSIGGASSAAGGPASDGVGAGASLVALREDEGTFLISLNA